MPAGVNGRLGSWNNSSSTRLFRFIREGLTAKTQELKVETRAAALRNEAHEGAWRWRDQGGIGSQGKQPQVAAWPWVGSRGRFVSGDLRRIPDGVCWVDVLSLVLSIFVNLIDACASNDVNM